MALRRILPELNKKYKKPMNGLEISKRDVLIAAITSCTNTSNPGVLLAAGLLAKKRVELGLTVKPHIKTSLARARAWSPTTSRAQDCCLPREELGFYLAGYGCTTCIGNARATVAADRGNRGQERTGCAAVLSATATFEARIHPETSGANFLASPPPRGSRTRDRRVVLVDFKTQPIGKSKDGQDVYVGHIWPTSDEIQSLIEAGDGSRAPSGVL